ncbi:hypothetical protein B0H10DRAFT_2056527 [Mycena sp. CBHHK59/15]|nr:hypothetical protein B0H10DRAFT_2056527 [Mycena sp. CBHHK59/15]
MTVPVLSIQLSLAGAWLNTAFYTVELILGFYCIHQLKLGRLHELGLHVMLFNDTAATLVVCSNVFLYLIWDVNEPSVQLWTLWTAPVFVVSTTLSAFIEQTFLLRRYFSMSRNRLISGFLLLIAVAHMAMGITVALFTGTHTQPDYLFGFPTTGFMASSILCACTDIMIALSNLWYLKSMNPSWRSPQNLIHAICINALTSGALVGSLTLASMIVLVFKQQSPIFSFLYSYKGRVYSIGVLVNIIARNAWQEKTGAVNVARGAAQTVAMGTLIFANINPQFGESRFEPGTGTGSGALRTKQCSEETGDDTDDSSREMDASLQGSPLQNTLDSKG